jgi:hypothetical protein
MTRRRRSPPPTAQELPVIQTAAVKRVSAKLDKLDIFEMLGREMGPSALAAYARLLVSAVSTSARPVWGEQMERTVLCLLGQRMTADLHKQFSEWLSVNTTGFHGGKVALKPPEDTAPVGWTLVRFVSLESRPDTRNNLEYTWRVEWGPWHGVGGVYRTNRLRQSWMAKRLGLKGRAPRYVHPLELVGAVMWAKIRSRKTMGGVVMGLAEVSMTSWIEDQNHQMLVLRKTKCPLNRKLPCHTCPVGTDQCPRAVRPITTESSHDTDQDQ